MQTKLLIDGALVAGEGHSERILNPATGECIAEVKHQVMAGGAMGFYGLN